MEPAPAEQRSPIAGRCLTAAVKVVALAAVVSLCLEYGFHENPARAPIPPWLARGVQLLTVLLFLAEYAFAVLTAPQRLTVVRERWLDTGILGIVGVLLIAQVSLSQLAVLRASTACIIVLQAILACRTGLGLVRISFASSKAAPRPARLILLSFAGVIFVGGLLLSLPRAVAPELRNEEGPYLAKRILNCFFTASSATCVTGLVIYDTEKDFTRFGQIVILGLIQIGGLGIMVLGSVFGTLAKRRLSLRRSLLLQDATSHQTLGQVSQMVTFIVLATFGCEAVGAAILYPMWPASIGAISERVFYSVFHAVSAFCNAGFALNRDNLIPYRFGWAVYMSIMPLIVIGGLGFPVLFDVAGRVRSWRASGAVAGDGDVSGIPRLPWRRRRHRFSLHSRLVFASTAFLIFGGALLIFVFESVDWRTPAQKARAPAGASSAVMCQMSVGERAAAALFQSVTTRTAGFNTVATDVDSMSSATHFVMCILMFIGASPASTGGGAKTVSVFVMVLAVYNTLRQRQSVESLGRTIPDLVVRRASVVVLLMFALVSGITLLLCVTEQGVALQEILFETCSACGTVGLSTGLTPRLTIAGRILIMAGMYAGRVGPLTALIALAGRSVTARYDYPPEQVVIG